MAVEQNSVQMIDALIRAGKQFRVMAYPNKTHSIEGTEYRIHLFHMIEDHFERELKPEAGLGTTSEPSGGSS